MDEYQRQKPFHKHSNVYKKSENCSIYSKTSIKKPAVVCSIGIHTNTICVARMSNHKGFWVGIDVTTEKTQGHYCSVLYNMSAVLCRARPMHHSRRCIRHSIFSYAAGVSRCHAIIKTFLALYFEHIILGENIQNLP